MTVETNPSRGVGRLYLLLSALACFALGAIALYSSGIGLVEPKFHRAAGFALALVVGIVASRTRREAKAPVTGTKETAHVFVDVAMLGAGLWAIWSFFFVQSQMETALYDVICYTDKICRVSWRIRASR